MRAGYQALLSILFLVLTVLPIAAQSTREKSAATPHTPALKASVASQSVADNTVDRARIVADLSTHTVAISTSFAGTRVLLYGALVQTVEENKPRPGIVVVIRGPERKLKMHRKRRIGGIWVNRDERTFLHVPGYYAILSNGPLPSIAPGAILHKAGIGFDVLKHELMKNGLGFRTPAEAAEYADALIRIQRDKHLYQEDPNGVVMSGRYLFRAQFDLPANVPLGTYYAKVYLFREGKLLGTYEAPLTIEKRGFEQFVYDLAHQRPLIYGVAAVVIAIAAGFLADVVFRKS